MKIRFKAPSGGGTLELDDASTVDQLLESIKSSTGFADVTVKYGWPPKPLTADQGQLSAQSLNLHRENLTVVPKEDASAAVAHNTPPMPEPVATTAPPQRLSPAFNLRFEARRKAKARVLRTRTLASLCRKLALR
ncbi:putative ubiquitin thioesterase otu1 protein [Daldinia childiae]|uniref:putative ubiquitin thioesterase otu1 protein n=1 Tax=Daldinia childiae TaxID=326645 RepID=UPI001445B687|nr:putative ubiquitin thioesterase otu1 protein [Daldinia childiae]KAF3059567.1 putative ubiquitin thioesterase otu1 protein [Daldinia childiae]